MKTLLIQQTYPRRGYLPLLVECFERNAKYCESHDIDYSVFCSEMRDINNGGWDKVLHVMDALKSYELVVWLDVDAIIYDLSKDLRDVPLPTDSIGAVRFLLPTPHLNVGVMYFKSGERVNQFMEEWISKYPGKGAWHEQEVFNTIKNEVVCTLPNEWNRNYTSGSIKPVVMGFHGFGDAENRLKLMRNVLAR